MSVADHLAEVRRRQDLVDRVHEYGTGAHADAWRQARRDALMGYLLEHLGVADLDQLPREERTIVKWIGGWDADTVAGVAQLMVRARRQDDG